MVYALQGFAYSGTLTGALTVDATYPNVLVLDPGGADRTITLEAEATSEGLIRVFRNSADAPDEYLTIADDAAATVATIGPGGVVCVYCDGTSWVRLFGFGDVPDDGMILRRSLVTVTTAQVLALNATPIALVAAPGADKFIEFVSAHLFLDYNSAAYAGVAGGEDLVITYTDGSGEEVGRQETTGFIDQTNDEHRIVVHHAVDDAVSDKIPVANAALVISLLSGEITTGDSPMIVETFYRVRTLAIA